MAAHATTEHVCWAAMRRRWIPAVWIALAPCSAPHGRREQGTVKPTPAAALPAPTAAAVAWPVLPAAAAPVDACRGPGVPFGEACARPPLECTIGGAKRVHCECTGKEWRCLSGAAAGFEGVRADAACGAVGASCELGNGLVFRTCACRDDHRWSCTGYGL